MQTRPFGPTRQCRRRDRPGHVEAGDGGPRAAVAALRRGLDLGMTHIDTAEMYGSGASRSSSARRSRAGATRCSSSRRCCPERLARRVRRTPASSSLRAARDRPARLLSPALARAPSARRHGRRVRGAARARARSSPGASATSTSTISRRRWPSPARARSRATRCSITCRSARIEHAVLPWCERHGVAVVGYTPFGSRFPAPGNAGGAVLAAIAAAHGATPRQVALAFLTRRPSLFAIPKASSRATPRRTPAPVALR